MNYEEYSALGVIADGALTLPESFTQALRLFKDGVVTVEVRTTQEKRSSAANRYWHGVVIPAFAEHCGYELSEMKEALSLELIPREVVDIKTGEVRIVPGHTSTLTVKEFNEMIERAQRLGAELGCYIPDPNELVTS